MAKNDQFKKNLRKTNIWREHYQGLWEQCYLLHKARIDLYKQCPLLRTSLVRSHPTERHIHLLKYPIVNQIKTKEKITQLNIQVIFLSKHAVEEMLVVGIPLFNLLTEYQILLMTLFITLPYAMLHDPNYILFVISLFQNVMELLIYTLHTVHKGKHQSYYD